jgi:hypothetical protein
MRFTGLLLVTVGLGFYMFETCIVESCLPEFKGTYDDTHDEIIAVDWTLS